MVTSHAPAGDTGTGRSAASTLLAKVPEITALFWVVKVLTTGMGEAASDWLLNRGQGLPGLGLPGALAVDVGLFVLAFAVQLAVRRYVPAAYWLAVLAVAVVGTVVADVTHFVLGVPLWATTAASLLVLAVTFALWYRTEGTVSIHSVVRGRREGYYWVAVFSTFVLGTAVGDLTAQSWDLGYLASAVLFLVLMAVPALAWYRFHADAVAMFWVAYVLTRPLGASVADWLAVPAGEGGLGLGAGPVTWVSIAVFVALVAHLSVARTGAGPDGGLTPAARRSHGVVPPGPSDG